MELTEIVLKNGQFVHRNIVETDLGTQDGYLSALANSAPIHTGIIHRLSANNELYNVALALTRTGLMAVTELNYLPFNCAWERSRSGYFVPSFPRPVPLGVVAEKLRVNVSELLHGRVMFGMFFENSANAPAQIVHAPIRCFMALILKGETEGRHFCYPNHYSDGKICMGSDFDSSLSRSSNKTPLEHLKDALNSFYTTNMNADLTSTASFTVMFRRNSDGKFISPTVEDIKNNCGVMSSAYTNMLVNSANNVL